MTFVTRQMLIDLGLVNVVALPPVTLINGRPIAAKIHEYPNLDAMKSAEWFIDGGQIGGLTLMCDAIKNDKITNDGYLVRLHAICADYQ